MIDDRQIDFGQKNARSAGTTDVVVIGAGGAGLRYFLAKDFDLRAGFDIAVGPESGAFYLTIGSGI